ncbi:hypothetical protein ACLOJK_023950 [Asimina triloba]
MLPPVMIWVAAMLGERCARSESPMLSMITECLLDPGVTRCSAGIWVHDVCDGVLLSHPPYLDRMIDCSPWTTLLAAAATDAVHRALAIGLPDIRVGMGFGRYLDCRSESCHGDPWSKIGAAVYSPSTATDDVAIANHLGKMEHQMVYSDSVLKQMHMYMHMQLGVM